MNEIRDCRECRKYRTDYNCRENCEGRDMFEPIKRGQMMKLVIDIPEDIKDIIDRKGTNEIVVETIWKAVKNGIPLEDIKVEIQNTILEQTYEKGQIDALEKIKPELLKEMEKLKGNSGCDYFTNRTIENCIGTAAEILDKRIKENKE